MTQNSTEFTQKKGDPTALGIFAYGFSLLALSIYASGFFPWSESITMIAPTLAFGGIFLLIAANWEYNNGNTFGATAFGTYSAFFLTFAAAHIGLKLGWFTALEVGHLVGIMALAFVVMTFIYWVGSFKLHIAINVTLLFLLLVFVMYAIRLLTLTATNATAIGTFPGSLAPAGYVGIVDSMLTMWVGSAVIINDRWETAGVHGPIPLFPFGKKSVAGTAPHKGYEAEKR